MPRGLYVTLRQRTRLAEALRDLRISVGLSQSELASQANVSRGYYSLLESHKVPSLGFMHKICKLMLSQPGVSPVVIRGKLWALFQAMVDLEMDNPFQDAVGSFNDELKLQSTKTVETVWIVSKHLAENHVSGFLNQTAQNLRDGVKYCYFVPQGDGELEWQSLLEALKVRERITLEDLNPGQLMAISCPRVMCQPSVRLINPGFRNSSGAVVVGLGATDRYLFQLPADQVMTLYIELDQARRKLGGALAQYQQYQRLFPSLS